MENHFSKVAMMFLGNLHKSGPGYFLLCAVSKIRPLHDWTWECHAECMSVPQYLPAWMLLAQWLFQYASSGRTIAVFARSCNWTKQSPISELVLCEACSSISTSVAEMQNMWSGQTACQWVRRVTQWLLPSHCSSEPHTQCAGGVKNVPAGQVHHCFTWPLLLHSQAACWQSVFLQLHAKIPGAVFDLWASILLFLT